MRQAFRPVALFLLTATLASAFARPVAAQSYGVELHNTLMPASGAMGGTSLARPQDVTSAINGNPATLSQFRGTQVMFGGTWAEPTFKLSQTNNVPLLGVDPYADKSTAQGVAVGNIGIAQDFGSLGLPMTVGLGFISSSGCIADFRHVPESNGTNTDLMVFSLPVAAGVDLTDELSVGASLALGIALFDGPFVGTGGMTLDYALRGTLGANYALDDCTHLGAYYQTKQSFTFNNAIRFGNGNYQDISMDLPQNVGLGFANNSLANGQLLLAVDVIYKLWDDADLYSTVYDNQLVVQCGAQYTMGRVRLRAGYAWAENPLDDSPEGRLGGIAPPGGIPAVRYTQALLAITSQHRLSAGVGVVDVLPGVDLDLMAGGMFRDDEQVGPFTATSIASYWIGLGMTWRFGRGACERLPAPNQWCPSNCN